MSLPPSDPASERPPVAPSTAPAPDLAQEWLARWAQGLAALLAAVVAVTCAATGTVERVTVGAPGGASAAPPVSAAPVTSALASAAVPAPVPAAPLAPSPLDRFHDALHGLTTHERQDHVRILWLGDSHTAADFMTEAVRERLQQRFGNGGPGFLRVGVSPYRHGRAKAATQGKWRRLPPAPAKETPTDDGVFGLGGMRVIPAGEDARATVELFGSAAPGPVRYDLAYRLPTAASGFEVAVDAGEPTVVSGRDGSGAGVRHLELEGSAAGELTVGRCSGAPELLAVTVEAVSPGLVLDTVGIDGARIATVLAWDGETFMQEVERRHPDLVVFAFGTNEVFQEWPVTRYGPQYEAVMARITSAAPQASCVFVGPTDVARGGGTDPRVLAIDEVQRAAAQQLGCAFISLYELMGGDGAYGRWAAAEPSLAAGDGVHLSRAGYERLGGSIAEVLLEPYARRYGD